MGLLDFVFPKYCVNCRKIGDYICTNCFSFLSFDLSMICLACNKPSIDGLTHPGCREKYVIDGAFCAVSYKGIMKKMIYNFKYKPYLADLKKTLVELFYESLIQQELFIKTMEQLHNCTIVLVPIPLYSGRLRKRGYNHSALLAEELSKKLNLKVIDILKRIRDTKSQFGLKLKDRKKNIKNAFSILPNIPISQYPNIFLVDDILTTGSTLLETARILKKKGVKKVWGLTLARD